MNPAQRAAAKRKSAKAPLNGNLLSEAINKKWRTTMGTELAKTEVTGGLVNWQQMRDQASVLVASGFLPESIKSPEQAMAIMLTGSELGLPPMQSLRGINVIKGNPTLKPELLLALCWKRVPGFSAHFGKCDENGAEFVCTRTGMAEPFVSRFTLADARKAGLTEKITWK